MSKHTNRKVNKMAFIELKDVTKEFNNQVVLRGIDLEIKSNEFVTLLGPSGCGKTTTLRIIGGFIEPTGGEVLFDGVDILKLPAHKRPTNTVFQRYALFPHLNVYENVAFGLRIKDVNNATKNKIKNIKGSLKEELKSLKEQYKLNFNKLKFERNQLRKIKDEKGLIEKETLMKQLTKQYEIDKKELKDDANVQIKKQVKKLLNKQNKELEVEKRVRKYLKLVGLVGFENRSVDKLSGGQQQRVAIARALINEPEVLLLDEPLAALDLKLRQEMQYELKEMQKNAGITFLYVTHDQEEALTMSDKIVVINEGEIQQIGSPEDIYNEPTNEFVAKFIGESNIIEGIMKDDYLVSWDEKDYHCVDYGFKKNEVIDIVLRPEDLDIVPEQEGYIDGVVDSVVFKGVHYEIDVKTLKRIYTIHTTDYHQEGKKVSITFDKEDIHVMEKW